MPASARIVGVEVLADRLVGREGGFLAVRRLDLVNVHADGTRSRPYLCDFAVRPKGVDAVVVAIWRRTGTGGASSAVEVLLRQSLRPPLHFGRRAEDLPIPDPRSYLLIPEVVAGIIEAEDRGEAGVRRRAAIEAEEEAGYQVSPDAVELLGAGMFPSPGAMAERFWFTAVEVRADTPVHDVPAGDGSPMEEDHRIWWLPLDEAIAACGRGEIEDLKTEVVLRRLRDRLAGRQEATNAPGAGGLGRG